MPDRRPRPATPALPSKPCTACGRAITWRKKWERDWDHVKYCSDRCRRAGVSGQDSELEKAIIDLLASRPPGSSICPSEAARRVNPGAWNDLMETTRSAARRLVARGIIEITQGGRPVDPSRAKGPIRLRHVPGSVHSSTANPPRQA